MLNMDRFYYCVCVEQILLMTKILVALIACMMVFAPVAILGCGSYPPEGV